MAKGKKAVEITETVLRDAHQSLIATRMTTEQILPIVEKLDNIGYHSLEAWGGATFDACLRFLNEDRSMSVYFFRISNIFIIIIFFGGIVYIKIHITSLFFKLIRIADYSTILISYLKFIRIYFCKCKLLIAHHICCLLQSP